MAKNDSVQLQVVDSKHGAELSESQKSFNCLTNQLEDLNSRLHEERMKLDEYLKLYSKKIPTYQCRLGKAQIAAAKLLSEAIDMHKFAKSEMEDIAGAIEMMLGQAFRFVEPDEDAKAVYNMWCEVNYNDLVEGEFEDTKSREGDLDLSDQGFNSFEAEHQFKKMQEAGMGEQQEQEKVGRRKISKKQLALEAREDAEKKAQLKSLRGVYYSLAKVLHPDKASNPDEILQKGELMKKVTVAYSKKDLSTLLKLEMEWLQLENDHIQKLSDEKLNLYNGVLKNQVDQMKMELEMLPSQPSYQSIRPFIYLTPKKAKLAIKATQEFFVFELNRYETICRGMNSKKNILMLIRDI